ncbi:hypothetical protein ACE1B6_28255 [Aerosakkonemataceae cyanobacterium BLCC-F154]|uniref:Uncharacterized protein n=1 Tax=Floridaenema fluviatile BLCC-F154 TaxID=3153640 RepID=A0ABV4YK98_9CYAN
MTESTQKRQVRRGRIFPEHQSSPEIRAKRIAQREELGKHCRQIFEQIRPQLMLTHYNWFIAIDAETGNYLLDEKFDGLMQKVKANYPYNGKVRLTTFRLNEDGYCGLI